MDADTAVRTTLDLPRALVRVIGELDVQAAPRLAAALDEVILAGATRVEVDLAQVPFVGAAALGVLCGGRVRLTRSGGTLRVRAWSAVVERVCAAAGLSRALGLAA